MAELSLPHARRRLLTGLLAAALLLSGCGGGEEPVETTPVADQQADQPVLDLTAPGPQAGPSRYGPGYWTDERMAKLDAAKARYRAGSTRSGATTTAPAPTPSPAPTPYFVPVTNSPAPTPSSSPEPQPSEEPDEEPWPDEEPDDGPMVLTSWGCQWSPGEDGLRGAACAAEITEGDQSEWSCFETRPWGDPDGAEQQCSGKIAGQDLAWTCTWVDTMACALDDDSAGWTCTWGGSWGECTADDAGADDESEGWFCADLRDPSEGNWYVCDGYVNRTLPLSALALPGLWRLPA